MNLKTKLRLISSVLVLALASITNSPAGTISFNYDSAGRLSTVTLGANQSIQYTYANSGSVTQRQITIGTPNPDSDGDGLADAWEQLHFGNLSRNGAGDFDGDGFNDLSEFLAGTGPNDAGSALKILPNPILSIGSVTVEWSSVPGKTYRLQFKTALADANWTNVPGEITAAGPQTSAVDNTANGQSPRFYRVILVQ